MTSCQLMIRKAEVLQCLVQILNPLENIITLERLSKCGTMYPQAWLYHAIRSQKPLWSLYRAAVVSKQPAEAVAASELAATKDAFDLKERKTRTETQLHKGYMLEFPEIRGLQHGPQILGSLIKGPRMGPLIFRNSHVLVVRMFHSGSKYSVPGVMGLLFLTRLCMEPNSSDECSGVCFARAT